MTSSVYSQNAVTPLTRSPHRVPQQATVVLHGLSLATAILQTRALVAAGRGGFRRAAYLVRVMDPQHGAILCAKQGRFTDVIDTTALEILGTQ